MKVLFIGACRCKGVMFELMPNVLLISQKKNNSEKRARLTSMIVDPGILRAAFIRRLDARTCNVGRPVHCLE
jgi:hypothetical protein